MSEFKNVTIIKKANVYFDGKVTSRTVMFADGTKKTLGIMMPGDYEFNTAAAEIMEMLGGSMEVLYPGPMHGRPLVKVRASKYLPIPNFLSRSRKWPTTAAPT